MGWLSWVAGVAVLVAAGFAVAYLPAVRAGRLRRRTGWSSARAAIGSAAISRDAAPRDVPAADELLARAESLVAAHGGVAAADEAVRCAVAADRLWRETAGE